MAKVLDSYNKSSLLRVKIKFNSEIIKFNLFKELKINDNILDTELLSQAKYYGFILMLFGKLKTQFELIKNDRKSLGSKLYVKYKKEVVNGRPINDEVAKSKVLINKEYIQLTKDCIKAKDDVDTIYACMKAFEQRKDLLQTLSSNTRKFNR